MGKPLEILDQTSESTNKVLNELGEVQLPSGSGVKAPNIHVMIHAFRNLKQNGVVALIRRVFCSCWRRFH